MAVVAPGLALVVATIRVRAARMSEGRASEKHGCHQGEKVFFMSFPVVEFHRRRSTEPSAKTTAQEPPTNSR